MVECRNRFQPYWISGMGGGVGAERGAGKSHRRHGNNTRESDRNAGDRAFAREVGRVIGGTHVAAPRTIGNCRGRPNPNRAIALATAGPIGGTPGSPTPVGFSVDATMVTSTSGIASMRNDR